MSTPLREKVVRQGNMLLRTTVICAAVFFLVHVLPKNYSPRSSLRLLCMIAFFASSIVFCWQMIEPRSRYLHLLFEWRFQDAPQTIERIWRRYLYSLDRLCKLVGFVAIAFLASNAVNMLSLWFHGFNFLSGLNAWVWWLSLGALVLLPFVRSDLITEVFQRQRQLKEQVNITTWYKPKELKSLVDPKQDQGNEKPMEVIDEHAFRAGGIQWHWDDFKPNCAIFGQPGSGKTICVLNALVDGLLASSQSSGESPAGLILDPKGDFRGKIQALCKAYGRSNDLLIIDPARLDHSIRWNPFDSADDELELALRFAATLEGLGMKQQDTSFWVDSAKKFIRHSIALIRLTNPPGVPPSFQQIGELAVSAEDIVRRTNRLDVTDDACEQCLAYFANEWIALADETRSSIQAYITNMIDPFLMEPYASMFSGRSTMRVAEMLRTGKILYVDMPVAEKEAMSRTIGTFVKLEYFREVLKARKKSRYSFFVCDEFQVYFTVTQGKGDADFFERSRESNHANIIATQNFPALLKQTQRPEPVKNLLGNCAVKLFLRNTDDETNEFASKMFGSQLVSMGSSNAGMANAGVGSMGVRGVGESILVHDQESRVVPPDRFAELTVPSQKDGLDYCEAIVYHGARAEIDHRQHKLRWRVHPI